MARKVTVDLVDDLDGSPARETVSFGIDGRFYEIDLSSEHAALLRQRLRRFVDAARLPERHARSAPITRGRHPDPALSARNRTIRFWARQRAIAVPPYGPIPRAVTEAYHRDQLGLPPDPGLPTLQPHSTGRPLRARYS